MVLVSVHACCCLHVAPVSMASEGWLFAGDVIEVFPIRDPVNAAETRPRRPCSFKRVLSRGVGLML